MKHRRTSRLLGAGLIGLAVMLALWPALRAGWRGIAGASASDGSAATALSIVAESPDERHLRLRFVRPNGAVGHLALVRADAGSAWQPESQPGAPGVLFGDGYPVFATPRFLAVHGLPVAGAIRPLDASIARETADDVTAIQSWGGEVAVCLWRKGKVVRLALAGSIFEALRAAGGGDACGRLRSLIESEDPAKPRAAACAAAIAACPELRDAALLRLRTLCEQGDAPACDVLLARGGSGTELWPEIDDCWRAIVDLSDAAAAAPRSRPLE